MKIEDINCKKREREGGDSSRSSSPAESLSSASESGNSSRSSSPADFLSGASESENQPERKKRNVIDSDDEDDMDTTQKIGASILAGVF